MPAARPYNHWDALKLLALLLMFIDHAGHFFWHDQMWLRAIGRGAAPVFMFLAGYAASLRIHRELSVLALILSLSDIALSGQLRTQNILWSIILFRFILQRLDTRPPLSRPLEWLIGGLALFPSMFLLQYGSLGFLIALGAYMLRRPERYKTESSLRFLEGAFVIYGTLEAALSGFSWIDTAVMATVLAGVFMLCTHIGEWKLPGKGMNPAAQRTLSYTARTSGYIYAFHLIALEWLTGIPF